METATSVGALGNSVPDIYSIHIQGLLIVFIITAFDSMMSYVVVKTLLKYADKIKILKNSITSYIT